MWDMMKSGEVTSMARGDKQRDQEQSRAKMLTSDSALLARQVRSLVGCKMLVKDRVEAACLVRVSFNSVLDVLGGVAAEVI